MIASWVGVWLHMEFGWLQREASACMHVQARGRLPQEGRGRSGRQKGVLLTHRPVATHHTVACTLRACGAFCLSLP